jgi:soluble cytochrome b562
MAANAQEITDLLQKARTHAAQAVEQDQPTLYRDAFEALIQAVEKLSSGAEEAHRDRVARAVEEFQGDEGI